MPFREELMEEKDECQISVIDVYDLASEIGKEFEKIIDQHGADSLTSLMPRVICALEYLEKLASLHENSFSHIQDLKTTITQLQNEKIGKHEDRQRYEKELEEIEDRMKEESHELIAMVTRLQDENRKLSTSLSKSEGTIIHNNGCNSEVDMKVISKLKEIVESQREQIRRHDRELQDNQSLTENFNSQMENLKQVNKDLKRRQRVNSGQIRILIDERADLQAALQEEQRLTGSLRQQLGLAEKENQDLSLSSNDSMDLTNKLVFDRDDPNRPRFTMTELKDILYERNELKARVSDLEDELKLFRPSSIHSGSHIICPPLDDDSTNESKEIDTDICESRHSTETDDETDPPVQGPLPYEPDDAPFKKVAESGIRKFFDHLSKILVDGVVGDVKEGSILPS